jgi:hypothetical protein
MNDRSEYTKELFNWGGALVVVGVAVLYLYLFVGGIIHVTEHYNRVFDDRVRAEARRERVRFRHTAQRNQLVLDRIEERHQAFCDETCRVTFMQPLMHEDIREDSDVAPEVVWRRVCRCLRVSPDGRFRSIERFTKNYSPLIDRDDQ